MKLRVVLADDHPFVLLGVRSSLAAAGGIEVVGEAARPSALFRTLQTTDCDVVLTDLAMPESPNDVEDGLCLIRRLRSEWPARRIVVLTSLTNVAILRAVLNEGVTGLLKKTDAMHEVVNAVRAAGCGRVYVGSSVQAGFAAAAPQCADSTAVPRLSPRESEVVRQFLCGRSVSEIAKVLNRDVRTVSRQKRDAMTKLGVSNDPGLFAFARALGFS